MTKGSDGETDFLPEALTRRERNILAHLSHHRSAKEIAGLEVLAPSSVRYYIHQVYAKLNVNHRADAIIRAKELGLLHSDTPNLTIPAAPHSNLPRQLTSFIGREEAITTLLAWVQQAPLVTLNGSGGTGKTRLALRIGEQALPLFTDGVWLVSLAPLDDPALVPQVTAATIGMDAKSAAIGPLCQFIGSKHLLLILDNCEHLVSAAADMAYTLLQACPRLHILATSREMLRVESEKAFRCPPLSLPDPNPPPSFTQVAQSEAVHLFCERARGASPTFSLNEANAALVAQICVRLDGIPLAIELAAARLRLLSLDQIASRLDNVFQLLTGGWRAALQRHQTLKALIDWSYNLLSEKEQILLYRLSVFADSWTLEAAEAIGTCALCGVEGTPTEEILGLLGQLVDKSLIEILPAPGDDLAPRFHMLQIIRQYASHRLQETASVDAVHELHLDYYLRLSLRAQEELKQKHPRIWMVRLEEEYNNLRLALEWAIAGSVVKGLRLAAALSGFWYGGSHRVEGVGILSRLLAVEKENRVGPLPMADPERMAARGKALTTNAFIGVLVGQVSEAMLTEAMAIFQELGEPYQNDMAFALYQTRSRPLAESLEMARGIDDRWLVGIIMLPLMFDAMKNGDLAQVKQYADERLSINQEMEDVESMGYPLWELGLLEFLKGDCSRARDFFNASLASFEEAGNLGFAAFSLHFLAWLALAQGKYQQAIQYSQEQLAAGQKMGISWVIADALGFLGWEAMLQKDEDLAIRYFQEALVFKENVQVDILSFTHYGMARVALSRGNFDQAQANLKDLLINNYYGWPPVQLGIQLFGILVQKRGQPARAATLFGAQEKISDQLLNVIPPPEREAYQDALSAVRNQLSSEEFAAACAAGKAMTVGEAIQYALDAPATFQPQSP